MTRPWGMVHASMLSHRKFILLTFEERGVWLTLLLYGLNSPSDDDLGNDAEIVAILHREGVEDAQAMLRRLVELRWLDRRGRRYRIHDWADWQADDPTGAKRQRRWRSRQVTGLSRDSHVTVTRQSRTRGEEKREQGILPRSPSANARRASRSNARSTYDDLLIGDDHPEADTPASPWAPNPDRRGVDEHAGARGRLGAAATGDRR